MQDLILRSIAVVSLVIIGVWIVAELRRIGREDRHK